MSNSAIRDRIKYEWELKKLGHIELCIPWGKLFIKYGHPDEYEYTINPCS